MSTAVPVYAVTCSIPHGSGEHLRVEVAGQTVTAVSPYGFRHTFELPQEVAVEQLDWQVYADVLELRAPFRCLLPVIGLCDPTVSGNEGTS
jgi:hypothetical protein